jgi:hypothetical protein
VEGAAPVSLEPHLGAHPRQATEGLVGLLVGSLLKLLQPGQSTMFFQDGLGTGTHIASPVPQAQLPEVGLYPWSCGGTREENKDQES